MSAPLAEGCVSRAGTARIFPQGRRTENKCARAWRPRAALRLVSDRIGRAGAPEQRVRNPARNVQRWMIWPRGCALEKVPMPRGCRHRGPGPPPPARKATPVGGEVHSPLGCREERRPLDDELAGIGGLDGARVELAAIVMEPPELHSALAHVMSFSRCVWDRLATRYRYFVLRYRPELSPGRAWA